MQEVGGVWLTAPSEVSLTSMSSVAHPHCRWWNSMCLWLVDLPCHHFGRWVFTCANMVTAVPKTCWKLSWGTERPRYPMWVWLVWSFMGWLVHVLSAYSFSTCHPFLCTIPLHNLYRMPQNAFFLQNCDLLVSQKTTQRHFFSTLHPLPPVIFATATVVAFVLLCNSRFSFHCYTQCEATPTQKLAWKWCCYHSWLLAQKITKGIHSCKPASLNRPIWLVLGF